MTTPSSPPPVVSSSSPHSEAYRWASRSRRKNESLTLQKSWKIKKALNVVVQSPHYSPDPVADMSLDLAVAAMRASYNDLLHMSASPDDTTTAQQQQQQQQRERTLSLRAAALLPEVDAMTEIRPLSTSKFCTNYLKFLETSVPAIEATRLGTNALDYVLPGCGMVGMWLEFGVSTGATLSTIARAAAAAILKSDDTGPLRKQTKIVYGFDSFLGLPTAWRVGFDVGKFDLKGVPPSLPDKNVSFQVGWFEDTLPIFLLEHPDEHCSLLHVDCDVYSSARCVLRLLRNKIVEGTHIVFDELLNYNGFERHEMRALFELIMGDDGEGIDESCLYSRGLGIEWIGSKHEGCMKVALRVVRMGRDEEEEER